MGRWRQHGDRPLNARLQALLSLWYALAIGSLGALHPLLASSLHREGLAGDTVAMLLMAFPLGVLVAGPVFGAVADRTGKLGSLLRWTAVGSGVAAVALALAHGPVAVAVALGALALLRAPLFPLVDALVVDLLGPQQRDYGKIRAWGSVSFIVMVQIAGAWIASDGAAPRILAGLCLAGCGALVFVLPAPPPDAAAALRVRFDGTSQLRLGGLWVLATLIGFSTAMYDFLFVVHFESLGGTPQLAAAAIGVGVALEVALMASSGLWLGRIGPRRTILIAAAAGTLRWTVTAVATEPMLAAAVQVLHGVSFGAFWVAAIALIAERAPPMRRAGATGALLATSAGLGPLLAMAAASQLLPRFGSRSIFVVAAAVALVAAILARPMLPAPAPSQRDPA